MREQIYHSISDPKATNHGEARDFSRRGGITSSSSIRAKGTGSAYNNKAPIVPIVGPPIPLALLPPPSTWPLFSAVPAINGRIMARNINGSGKQC